MRLDKYLKVSRIIKRRTVANDACDAEHVTVNGKDYVIYKVCVLFAEILTQELTHAVAEIDRNRIAFFQCLSHNVCTFNKSITAWPALILHT